MWWDVFKEILYDRYGLPLSIDHFISNKNRKGRLYIFRELGTQCFEKKIIITNMINAGYYL